MTKSTLFALPKICTPYEELRGNYALHNTITIKQAMYWAEAMNPGYEWTSLVKEEASLDEIYFCLQRGITNLNGNIDARIKFSKQEDIALDEVEGVIGIIELVGQDQIKQENDHITKPSFEQLHQLLPVLQDGQQNLSLQDMYYLFRLFRPMSEFDSEGEQKKLICEALEKFDRNLSDKKPKDRETYLDTMSEKILEKDPDNAARLMLLSVVTDLQEEKESHKKIADYMGLSEASFVSVLGRLVTKLDSKEVEGFQNPVYHPLELKMLYDNPKQISANEATLWAMAALPVEKESQLRRAIGYAFSLNDDKAFIDFEKSRQSKLDDYETGKRKRQLKREFKEYINANVERIIQDPVKSARYHLMAAMYRCQADEDTRNEFKSVLSKEEKGNKIIPRLEAIAENIKGIVHDNREPIILTLKSMTQRPKMEFVVANNNSNNIKKNNGGNLPPPEMC